MISRPATCHVSIAGEHFFDSGAITCVVYPSANRTLLLQELTGHLGAQPVETHGQVVPLRAVSIVLSAILNY